MSDKIKSLLKKLRRFGYNATPKSRTTDVVCNMKVNEGLITSEYRNKTYSFCSEHCKAQFDVNPAQYAD